MALWGKQDALAVTGTSVAVENGDATVTGTGTAFNTQVKNGDTLIISDVKYKVLSVTSATALELSTNYEGSTDAEILVANVQIQQSPKNLNTVEKRSTLGIDTGESQAGGDNVVVVSVETRGVQYLEVPAVTFTGGAGTDAAATATVSGGAVASIAVTNTGSAYTSEPTVAIALPKRTVPTAGVDIGLDQITYATHGLTAGTKLTYNNGGSTALAGLTNNVAYNVSALGLAAGVFRLAASEAASALRAAVGTLAISGIGGQFTCAATTLAANDRVRITGTLTGTGTITGYATGTIYKVSAVTGVSPNVTGFTLTTEADAAIVTTAGTTAGLTAQAATIVDLTGTGNNAQFFSIDQAVRATAIAALGSGVPATITNPGWVLKTVGTGGRAGRVQYETLVAGRSLIVGDANDDLEAPDAA